MLIRNKKIKNMKNLMYLLLVAGVLFSCTPRTDAEKVRAGDAKKAAEALGQEYALVTDASTLRWRGSKPGGEHYGTVNITEGSISLKGDLITAGDFTIDLNTIVCEDLTNPGSNARLVGHLKSQDFFYVEQYPLAKFEIVSVTRLQNSPQAEQGKVSPTHELTGNLTMRGVTKSITFPARIEISDDKVNAATNPFAIDRTQWGVNYNSKSVFAELRDNFIEDNMILSLEVEFRKSN